MHDAYLFEVKKPSESKYPWDYYKLVATIPGRPGFPAARRRRLPAGQEMKTSRAVVGFEWRKLDEIGKYGLARWPGRWSRWGSAARRSAADKVVIGDIDDMSGVYADVIGPKGVEGIKMAIADFGGSVLGQPIELLTFDHQNKPDLGAAEIPRMGRPRRPDHGARRLQHRRLARHVDRREGKEGAVLRDRRGRRFADRQGLHALHVHYGYDTTALGNGTATAILNQGGKSWFFLTADYAFGTQLAAIGRARRQRRRRQGARRRARAARHVGLLVVPAAGAELGRRCRRPRQRRRRLRQLAEGRQRVRHHEDA